MFDALRIRALRVLRVPSEPDPPAGAPGTLRVFRAGRNLYQLRLVHWLIGQAGALAGILFSLAFLAGLERSVEAARADIRRAVATKPATPVEPLATSPLPAPTSPHTSVPEPTPGTNAKANTRATKARSRSGVVRMAERWPGWLFPLLQFLEWVGILLYVAQIPITFALVRLDYELRWYMVTDRSLRIRAGLMRVQEATMSFANVQQVVVTQGPLQRLLGIADVRVQSAGGGGDQAGSTSLHTGIFHGVENAHEIRDLILERLRQFRETGLGDPEESRATAAAHSTHAALAAAQELLDEARALRRVIG